MNINTEDLTAEDKQMLDKMLRDLKKYLRCRSKGELVNMVISLTIDNNAKNAELNKMKELPHASANNHSESDSDHAPIGGA